MKRAQKWADRSSALKQKPNPIFVSMRLNRDRSAKSDGSSSPSYNSYPQQSFGSGGEGGAKNLVGSKVSQYAQLRGNPILKRHYVVNSLCDPRELQDYRS